MPPKAVIFDCDGVGVDTEPATLVLLQQDFAERGLDLTLDDLNRDFVGSVMAEVGTRARPGVERVAVTVHKPQAPIPVPFADVAVTIRRSKPVDAAPLSPTEVAR